jgi:glycosyltransferase involved in cell wall biosynthesis
MLSDYIIYHRNAFAKKCIHQFLGRKLLKSSWLHVSTELEWNESKKIIPSWEGKIIPNLVKFEEVKHTRAINPVFTIGFLSRVDHKKGLDILIKALSKVSFKYKLVIAGNGDPHYINTLKSISTRYGNHKHIEWIGWKSGESKFEFLTQIDLMALISRSENFAVVVIESLSVGTPVFISDNVGLFKYILDKDYGWVTDMNIENVTRHLENLYRDGDKFKRINLETPLNIEQEYDQSALANKYVELYTGVLTKK